jgi:hypothetical protein
LDGALENRYLSVKLEYSRHLSGLSRFIACQIYVSFVGVDNPKSASLIKDVEICIGKGKMAETDEQSLAEDGGEEDTWSHGGCPLMLDSKERIATVDDLVEWSSDENRLLVESNFKVKGPDSVTVTGAISLNEKGEDFWASLEAETSDV